MFIMILFGYKLNRIFTIDCLTASLIDCIWTHCLKDMQKLMTQKEEIINEKIYNLTKKINSLEKKNESIDKALKEEEKKAMENQKDDKKKGAKAPPAKKPKDPTNPLEKEKLEVTNELEKAKDHVTKYNDKLNKLKLVKEKYSNLGNSNNFSLELIDKLGEKKFVKSKLDVIASTFLSDKNSYFLACINGKSPEEEEMELVNIDGYCLRTLEEDEKAVEEEQNILDKNKKDNKKKGAKK